MSQSVRLLTTIAISLGASLVMVVSPLRFHPQPAMAQADSQPAVFDTEQLSATIRELKVEYRAELEAYRREEQLYQIAQGQHEKLQTLTSLENLVRSTQSAMRARNQVLRTYFELLRLRLQQQPGIDLDLKQRAGDDVVAGIQVLDRYKQILEPTLDKPALQAVATTFDEDIEAIEDTAYQVISLLALGELQTLHDKTVQLTEEIKNQTATQGGALKIAQRDRAFGETERLLAQIKPEISQVELRLNNPNSQPYETLYLQVIETLDDVSNQLAQVMAYLQEILQL